jgi:hypothetical protein
VSSLPKRHVWVLFLALIVGAMDEIVVQEAT